MAMIQVRLVDMPINRFEGSMTVTPPEGTISSAIFVHKNLREEYGVGNISVAPLFDCGRMCHSSGRPHMLSADVSLVQSFKLFDHLSLAVNRPSFISSYDVGLLGILH